MNKALTLSFGGLLILVGLLWTFQGLGYVSGSPMTGATIWAVIGPVVAGAGVALMVIAVRRRG